jgi:hypothetical protein
MPIPLDVHAVDHAPDAIPGWPGSVFEQLKLIGPLTDPTRSGGRAEDAFDVVIPSLPGFRWSEHLGFWGLETATGARHVTYGVSPGTFR